MDLAAIILVALVLVALLVGLLAYAARGGRQLEAAGGPKEVTGALAMERKIVLALAMLFATGGFMLAYGLLEPTRQADAAQQQTDISIRRGIETYSSVCYSCHGLDGKGAVVPSTDPPRVAPALHRPDLRPTDPDEAKKTYDAVSKTISRGRPNTPMPAWARVEGGILLDEQINELTLMILNGDKKVEQGGKTALVWEHVKDKVSEAVAHGGAAPIPVPEGPKVALSPDAEKGLALWRGEGACIGCHSISGIGGGTTGPELSNIGNLAAARKAGMSAEDYIREHILTGSQGAACCVTGYQPVMPPYKGRLTDEQVSQLIAYFLTLKQ